MGTRCHGMPANRRCDATQPTPAPAAAPALHRPTLAEDYTAPFGVEEAGIVAVLRSRGWRVYVLPLKRTDWLKARGRRGRGQATLATGWRRRCLPMAPAPPSRRRWRARW